MYFTIKSLPLVPYSKIHQRKLYYILLKIHYSKINQLNYHIVPFGSIAQAYFDFQ